MGSRWDCLSRGIGQEVLRASAFLWFSDSVNTLTFLPFALKIPQSVQVQELIQGKFLPTGSNSWYTVVHQITSLQDGLFHDAGDKARLKSSPSLHKALHVFEVRHISLIECRYLSVLLYVLETAPEKTARDGWTPCVTLPCSPSLCEFPFNCLWKQWQHLGSDTNALCVWDSQ